MANKDLATNVEWMWQSNPHPYAPDEPVEWSSYTEESSAIIEEAYRNGKRYARLTNYTIDLEECMQILNKDTGKRRPVKRVEHSKESWLKRIKTLGSGGFGTVYKGIYRGSEEVAYKVTEGKLSSDAIRETNILKTLCHPNIVRYIDVIHTSRHTLLVMELIECGTVYEFIRATSRSAKYWSSCLNMMIDVAYAMTYLHEKNIIHADLKSDNILLRSNGAAVLSDFGLSTVIESMTMQQSYVGATRWLAPELCGGAPERCSFKSDVWAYGCVLLEIVTKKLPWEEMYETNDDVLRALANERNANRFQDFCYQQEAPGGFRKNLRACCTWSKMNRPDFAKIIRDFHQTPSSNAYAQREQSLTHDEIESSSSQRRSFAMHRSQSSFDENGHSEQMRHPRALYDSGNDEHDESYTSSTARRKNHAGCTPFNRKPAADRYTLRRSSVDDLL